MTRSLWKSALTMALLLPLLGSVGCSKEGDVIVKTGEGDELGEREIDADPLALLPGGANGAFNVDAKALRSSNRHNYEQRLLLPTWATSSSVY